MENQDRIIIKDSPFGDAFLMRVSSGLSGKSCLNFFLFRYISPSQAWNRSA